MSTYSVSSKEHWAPEMPLSILENTWAGAWATQGTAQDLHFLGHRSCPNNSYLPIAVSAVLPRDITPAHSQFKTLYNPKNILNSL